MGISYTVYEIKCEYCGKQKITKDKPYRETYVCEKCKKELKEPKITECGNLYDFLMKRSDYVYDTGKRIKDIDLEKLLFKEFGVCGIKAEKAYSIAYENGHDEGETDIYNEFEKLVDLIK
jgi:hypothetical protein